MPDKVLVDLDRPVFRSDSAKIRSGLAGRWNFQRMLLKEQNVGGDFGSGICLEGCIREPQRAQQYRTIGQMASNGRVLLVHRVVAGDESHNSAGTYNIKILGQEVVENRAREVRTSAIRRIEHWVVAE